MGDIDFSYVYFAGLAAANAVSLSRNNMVIFFEVRLLSVVIVIKLKDCLLPFVPLYQFIGT